MIAVADPVPGVAHHEHGDVWGIVAKALRPRVRVRPSAWARANVVLGPRQTRRPGPFRDDFQPFTRAVLDYEYEHPEKKGIIAIKPAQVGFTLIEIVKTLCAADTDPGSFLYITSDAEKAAAFAESEWEHGILAQSHALRERLAAGAVGMRELTTVKPFAGGVAEFYGAGSETGLTSFARKRVALDEYQLSSDNYLHGAGGDLWQAALDRVATYRGVSIVNAFGHPRFEGEDIHALYRELSTRERWVFDCPHAGCGAPVFPRWEMVRIGGIDPSSARSGEAVRADPEKAVMHCPHCGKPITDAQRQRSLWEPTLGGTGRFEGDLSKDEAATREYGGVWVTRFCCADVTIPELARRAIGAVTDAARVEVFGKGFGEPYRRAGSAVPPDLVERCARQMDQVIVPGGAFGAHVVAVGVDVQAPESNPHLVTAVLAFAADGMAYAVALHLFQGWTALFGYLRACKVTRVDPETGRVDHLVPEVVGVDCQAWTGQVLTNCRTLVFAESTGAQVKLLPLAYKPHVKSTAPAVVPPDAKRIDPNAPHRGLIERFDLHRQTWVNRAIRRWIDGRMEVRCPAPNDLQAHLSANVERPKRRMHSWENTDEWEWDNEGRRDDWLQACAYAECAAALKLGLDRVHERAMPVEVGPGAMSAEEYAAKYGARREGGSGGFRGWGAFRGWGR